MDKLDNFEIVKQMYDVLDDRKAKDIKVIDISEVSIMTDYFVIASGGNINHVHALSEHLEDKMRECGVHYDHMEGFKDGTWILMDYGDIVVHIFDEASRDFYDIERVWRDGKTVNFE